MMGGRATDAPRRSPLWCARCAALATRIWDEKAAGFSRRRESPGDTIAGPWHPDVKLGPSLSYTILDMIRWYSRAPYVKSTLRGPELYRAYLIKKWAARNQRAGAGRRSTAEIKPESTVPARARKAAQDKVN